MPTPRICAYTCLLNGYEELNEQPVARDSGVEFLCFTDDPALRSETWTMRRLEPVLPGDPGRSQRFAKLCAHRLLPEHDVSLYLDNSVILRQPPEVAVAELLPDGAGLACFEHSFRETVDDEFDEVVRLGFDAEAVCREQQDRYRATDPGSLSARPLFSGLLVRRHHDPAVIAAMELWLAQVLRYSRRDQLSLRYALRATGLVPTVHAHDNFESPFHTWPVIAGRERSRAGTSAAEALEERVRQLERDLEHLRGELRARDATRRRRWAARLRAARGRVDEDEPPQREPSYEYNVRDS